MSCAKLYIDDADAYSRFGVLVTDASYNELVAFPSMKAFEANAWPEEDGKEFDLSSPALDTKEISLECMFESSWKFNDFLGYLSDKGYHAFRFTDIGRTYRLRLVSQPGYELYSGSGVVKFTFADDFPRDTEYTYQEPVNTVTISAGYELDGRDLSDYGVLVLDGSDEEIRKAPAVKKNLLQDFQYRDGAIYDGEFVKFQTKDVALKCLMRAPTWVEFWRNRDALLHDLTRLSVKRNDAGYDYSDAERRLFFDKWYEEYPCYYANCQTEEFGISNGVWWTFTLTLVFTSFRIEETDYLLASEAGELILTEDEEYYIDSRDYADKKEENIRINAC